MGTSTRDSGAFIREMAGDITFSLHDSIPAESYTDELILYASERLICDESEPFKRNMLREGFGPNEWFSLLTLSSSPPCVLLTSDVTVQAWQKALAVVCFHLPVMFSLVF
ncbi:hypothetical protein M5K25_020598 [Dendrobium thyrsiflorum]|uniref:Uncharacterized protein n=1 Tax=Dendrobium thyrsiflorum TaxID=117978 RepID=A0ABD0UA95_DENTH